MLTATSYPGDFVEEDSFVLLDTGFEDLDDDTEIPAERLRFMTTLLIRADDAAPVVTEFRGWWEENASGPLELEAVATDVSQLDEQRVTALDELEDDSWTFRSSFAAFHADHVEALAEARSFILECDLKIH